jgi:hypothetical protein
MSELSFRVSSMYFEVYPSAECCRVLEEHAITYFCDEQKEAESKTDIYMNFCNFFAPCDVALYERYSYIYSLYSITVTFSDGGKMIFYFKVQSL